MNLHWLIPITVDAAFQFTSKNEMARAYKGLGYKITTTAAYVNEKIPLDGFSRVDYVHTPSGSIWRKLVFHWQLFKSIWGSKADVIMFGFQATHLLPFACIVGLLIGRPKLIMDIRTVPVDLEGSRGKIETFRYQLALRLANRFCDGFTVITPMLGETVLPKMQRLADKMGVWTSGVHLDQFQRSGEDRRIELGLEGKQVLLYHGVMSPNRGLQNALRAVHNLRDEMPELVFLFVGDGTGKHELEVLSKELGIDDRVVFTGKVPFVDIATYIRCANLAILPFPNITWWAVSSPIKLMEYLAVGIPIVVTNIEANRWVAEQTGGAILAVDDKPASLVASIRVAFNDGVEPATPELLEATISWNRQASQLAEFVKSL